MCSALGVDVFDGDMLGLQISVIIFGLLLLITNILISIINKRFWTWLLVVLASMLYVINILGWEFQLTTILYSIIGPLTIASKFLLEKMISLFLRKIQNGFIPK